MATEYKGYVSDHLIDRRVELIERDGDVIEVTFDEIGTLRNPVVWEK